MIAFTCFYILPTTSREWPDMCSKMGFGEILANAFSDIDTLTLHYRQEVHSAVYMGDLNAHAENLQCGVPMNMWGCKYELLTSRYNCNEQVDPQRQTKI